MRRIGGLTRRSVRARMTLLYGGLFAVITSGVLFAAEQFQRHLLDNKVRNLPDALSISTVPCDRRPSGQSCSTIPFAPGAGGGTPQNLSEGSRSEFQQSLVATQRGVTLVAIAVITVLAFAVCWWLTGRLLRPLHRITATAHRLSLSTLHERIALTGPQDELKELADTFDAMLDRLEHAVDSQRRFVANASHELRTPLTIQRTAIEIGLADPTPERVDRIRTELLRNTERSERLIEGLLVLAQGERGLDTRSPVELDAVVRQVVEEHRRFADRAGVTIVGDARPVTVAGDEVMLGRLAANLVQNAIRHNHEGGEVVVEVSAATGLTVRNTGPHVPAEQVDSLFEPFRRLRDDRTGSSEGAGLGLSIVAAITHAHGGAVHATPNPDGGLTVTVNLPALTPAAVAPAPAGA
ncbi:ATP-binding protein [Actinomadura meridiana]|uniref:histidine kinase n=1 Tax=Actinomadura meridiana TaxID=559626 RepID=A0ABP8BZL8_9ACTN